MASVMALKVRIMAMLKGRSPELVRRITPILVRPSLQPNDLLLELVPLDLPEDFLRDVLSAVETSAQDAPGHGGQTGTGSDVAQPRKEAGSSAGGADTVTLRGTATSSTGGSQGGRLELVHVDEPSGTPAETINPPTAGTGAGADSGTSGAISGAATAANPASAVGSKKRSRSLSSDEASGGEEEDEDEEGNEGAGGEDDPEEGKEAGDLSEEGDKSVSFGEASKVRVHKDVVAALWRDNIGKRRAKEEEVEAWKKQRKDLKRPENFSKQRPFSVKHLDKPYKPVDWASKPPKLKAKDLDTELFQIQERLFPLSWGLAYVSDYLNHPAEDKDAFAAQAEAARTAAGRLTATVNLLHDHVIAARLANISSFWKGSTLDYKTAIGSFNRQSERVTPFDPATLASLKEQNKARETVAELGNPAAAKKVTINDLRVTSPQRPETHEGGGFFPRSPRGNRGHGTSGGFRRRNSSGPSGHASRSRGGHGGNRGRGRGN